MSKRTGVLVTFEGTEGAGKSTLIREVARLLSEPQTREVVITREPGGTSLAEKIRSTILAEPMDSRAELFLYEAARSEHVARIIRPAVERGAWVLCDRFTDSSLAYQSHARGLPWKEVKSLNAIATGGLQPDLTVLLDIDPETGLRRARDQNRFEQEGVAFQRKVRLGFLKARSERPARWLVLKVKSQTPQELADRVVRELKRRFKNG